MTPYMEQILLAQRWQKCVDFGSPMSAWTPQMLKAWKDSNGDVQKALKLIGM